MKKYYKKIYEKDVGFQTFYMKDTNNIHTVTIYDNDGQIVYNCYHKDSIMINEELKYCKKVEAKEFYEATKMLNNLIKKEN